MKPLIIITQLVIALIFFTGVSQDLVVEKTQNPIKDSLAIKRIDTLSEYIAQQFFKRNYDKTIEFGELALSLSKENNYYNRYYNISSFLGNGYIEIEDSLRAKIIFKRSIEKAIEQKDTIGRLVSEIDFANFYALREEHSSKKRAIRLYKNSIPLASKLKSINNLLILHSNISELYLDLKNTQLAEIYVLETEKFLTGKDIFEGYLGSTALNKARLLSQKGNYEEAESYFSTSLKYFEKINYLDGIIDVFKYLIENALGQNDFQKAFNAQQQLDEFELEKYNEDKIEAIQTVTTRFKLDEIENELKEEKLLSDLKEEQARRDTTIFWVKIASIILFLFFGFALYSYLKRRKLVINLLLKNKQYLEEKERSEVLYKAKSRLLSNITHELRTPMYGIIGISNALLENKKFKAEISDLSSLKFSADYLLALINNVLHFNKIEANQIDPLQISSFNIRTLIQTIIETSKFLSEDHPNTYVVNIDESIPTIIRGDKTKLSQILINLVGNASKFTDDGEIEISLNEIERLPQSTKISFVIEDNGRGVKKNKINSLFNQYSQTEDRQNFMGTGLGLPIVFNLLEQQNSKLKFESTLGFGTKVSFTLSFQLESVDIKKEDPESLNENILEKLTILVVDDNKINLLVTRKIIERYGAICIIAASGQESIIKAKEEHIDLILMDINMPEMNGFEATEIIRTFNQDIPIVALTAVEKEKVIGDHSFNLMNDIIIKPYSNENFVETILKNLNKLEA